MKLRIKLRSKNETANLLRSAISTLRTKIPVVLRLYSNTPIEAILSPSQLSKPFIEWNTLESIKNSANKLKTKKLMVDNDIPTAEYWEAADFIENKEQIFEEHKNIIAKKINGSKGIGMKLFHSIEEYNEWVSNEGPNLKEYFFERYYNYNREYRIHLFNGEMIYTNRKMLKEDAEERWYRNDSNSVWYLETNPLFDKPVNFDKIVEDCKKLQELTGLNFSSFDIRIQSSKHKDPKYIILETNSGSSMGEGTALAYKNAIEKYLIDNNLLS